MKPTTVTMRDECFFEDGFLQCPFYDERDSGAYCRHPDNWAAFMDDERHEDCPLDRDDPGRPLVFLEVGDGVYEAERAVLKAADELCHPAVGANSYGEAVDQGVTNGMVLSDAVDALRAERLKVKS
jgi:hypothetical protein